MIEASIIIPTMRQNQIIDCIESVRKNTKNVTHEIIIVGPKNICINKSSENIKYIIDEEMSGCNAAIRKGFEHCSGNYVTLLSDESRVQTNWLKNMIAFMKPHRGEIVQGSFRTYNHYEEEPIGYYGKLFAPFFLIEKAIVNKIGGFFDPRYRSFYHDPDLSLRIWEAGGQVLICPNAWIYHPESNDKIKKDRLFKFEQIDKEQFIERWQSLGTYTGCQKIQIPLTVNHLVGKLPYYFVKLHLQIKKN